MDDLKFCSKSIFLFFSSKILEEPGVESNELDTIAPTVVRPHSNETFYPNGNSELVSSFFNK